MEIQKNYPGIIRTLCFSVMCTFLASCGLIPSKSAAPKPVEKTPHWALNPPPNTAQALYGTAMKRDRDAAIKSALAQIASNLSVNISAETLSATTMSNGQENMRYAEDVKAQVNKTQFSNYRVIDSQAVSNGIWVLVEVNKAQMASDLQSKINSSKTQLSQRFTEFEKVSSLEKAQLAPKLQSELMDMRAAIATLNTIQKTSNTAQHTSFILTKEAELRKAKSSMKVKIEHDRNTDLLANKIATLLSEKDVKVVEGGSRKGKSVIVIKSKVDNLKIQNAFVAKIELKLDAIDDQGKTIKSYLKTLNGASPSSYDAALDQANVKLFKALQDEKVMESFGF